MVLVSDCAVPCQRNFSGRRPVGRRPLYLFAVCRHLRSVRLGGGGIASRFHIKRAAIVAGAVFLLAAMGCKSWFQTETWKDSITLYSQALKATGGNEPMHRNLALELVAKGRIDEAIQHYREAIRLDPGRSGIHYSLGHLLADQGMMAEAMTMFSPELTLNPNYVPALKELGFPQYGEGRLPEAAADFRRVLQINPAGPAEQFSQSLLAAVPEPIVPDNSAEPAPDAAEGSAPVGPTCPSDKPSGGASACSGSIAMVLVCVALGFLMPGIGRGVVPSGREGLVAARGA